MKRFFSSVLLLVPVFLGGICAADSFSFSTVTVDDAIPGAYQAALADINNDGMLDIAALGEGKSGVYWYENPSWKKRPICTETLSRFIDLAFYDLDDDGELEVVLASDFSFNAAQSKGSISWLDRRQDIDQPWTVYPIHAEPTTHRIRWADVKGNGKKCLIAAPITAMGSKSPNYDQKAIRLLSFSVPKHPQTDKWPMQVIHQTLHLVHGLFVEKGPKSDRILTAGLEGITASFLHQGTWQSTSLHPGAPSSQERTGSSEIAVGRLRSGIHYLATIDPWHGNQVAVYMPYIHGKPSLLHRTVIDDSFIQGHALACADLDGDGDDEIIAGYRGEGYTLYLYDPAPAKQLTWTRHTIDKGTIAVQGFAVGDVNQDGRIDFVATGGKTHNLKLYLNDGS